jgi:hypothetical protein
MKLLKRVLYWEAALLAAGGLFLALFPAWVLRSLFAQPPTVDAWVRIVGVQGFGFGMLSVVIAHRIEQLWWASWGFVITGIGIALVSISHALFGVPEGVSAVLWWVLGVAALIESAGLLAGLALAGTERDPHDPPIAERGRSPGPSRG